jgi:hypothetical protein
MTKLLALEVSLVAEVRKSLFTTGYNLHARRDR